MSKFITSIPVDVEAIKAILPDRSYVHGATFNPQEGRVELVWEHDDYRTPYTFPVELPLSVLEMHGVDGLPDGIKFVRPGVPTPQQVSLDKPVAKVRKSKATTNAKTSIP